MLRSLTALIEREGDGYVAICPEFDVASQGSTLTLFFETADRSEIDLRRA